MAEQTEKEKESAAKDAADMASSQAAQARLAAESAAAVKAAKDAADMASSQATQARLAAESAAALQRKAATANKEADDTKMSLDPNFVGIIGGPVAIYGRNLGVGGQLSINGQFVQATAWRPSGIKGTVPAHMQPGPVTATIVGTGVTATGRLVR